MGVVSADDPLAFLKQEVADGDQHIRVQATRSIAIFFSSKNVKLSAVEYSFSGIKMHFSRNICA